MSQMKTNTLVTTLTAFVILVSCTSKMIPIPAELATPTFKPRADNFSFIFHDRTCEINILDTSSNTLIHTPVDETTSITIPFWLTDQDLEAVYQKAMAINLFDYPSEIRVPPSETPIDRYELRITNDAKTISVIAIEDFGNETPILHPGDFWELIKLVRQIIYEHSEYKELPIPKAGCA